MLTGAEVLLNDSSWLKKLKNKRVAYLGHSAGVDQKGNLILSSLLNHKEIELSVLFSPQHGFGSSCQANMITTEDTTYKNLNIYSLYSEQNRHLTSEMERSFDVLLFDLQDVGCRIYTYLTTLCYLLEDCEKYGKTIFVLDRPNPLGRYVEGSILKKEFKSFVGVGSLPMSHGLTMGELALWYIAVNKLKTDLFVIPMQGYHADDCWPADRPWVLPSPNMTSFDCAKCYPGVVLLEGTHVSEGRGTTKPFEIIGRPDMNTEAILQHMKDQSPSFLDACFLREMEFEPVFDKFKGQLCHGFQIHLDKIWAGDSKLFCPYRFTCAFLKAFRHIHPFVSWKSKPPYEYEFKLDPIDIISGGPELQKWLEKASSSTQEWDDLLSTDELQWKKTQKEFFLYK